MLLRLLFWILLLAALIWLWRRTVTPRQAPGETEKPPTPMVRCSHCGVHLPREQALSSDGAWFCSSEHLQQHRHD